MSSSDSEEDLSAFASVAVDSAFIQKQAKVRLTILYVLPCGV